MPWACKKVLDEFCKAVNYDQDYVKDIPILTVSDELGLGPTINELLLMQAVGFLP